MQEGIILKRNYAFIDSNNLYLGVSDDVYDGKGRNIYSGWKLDYKRFRIYLRDKYKIEKAFLFIGYQPGNQSLYTKLQENGYVCVFKPTLELKDGEYFLKENKLEKVLAPNQFGYSSLLDRLSTTEKNIMSFVSQLKEKLEYKKR